MHCYEIKTHVRQICASQQSLFFVFWLLFFSPWSHADQTHLLVQSTTSTANSGLYDYLIPLFEADYDIKINVVAVGTGQAIRNARNCDADVLLVHAKNAEQDFVEDGFGLERFDLMYNDFVVIGPTDDSANIRDASSVVDMMKKIVDASALFASRGDNSGTHKKELALWANANIDVIKDSRQWYRSTGSGMGATINTAIGLGAYTLTDRASWISFKNKQDYSVLYQGDPLLFNQYGVILVNPAKCPSVEAKAGQQFINWLLSPTTQQTIAQFRVNNTQLFYPNAK